ncbi:10 kDa chaperonin [uncultured archaeon]|nr:10 kDa chaperonin [uncultured archaeon]
MKFKPYGEVVLVRPKFEDERMESGLYKPQNATEKPTSGEILRVGTVKAFKVGDYIAFRKYAGYEWEEKNEKLLILPVEHILGWDEDGGK